MKKIIDSISKLGDGTIEKLPGGQHVFRMDSFEGNPIVKPEDLGLVWEEDGGIKKGAVFNAGAEIFGDRVILTPRCHKNYRKATFYDEKLKRERACLENYVSEVWLLQSEDGVNFRRLDNCVIRGDGTDHADFTYGIEDIRIVKAGDRYILIGCGKIKPPFKGTNADRIAIYQTEDFREIRYCGIIRNFDSRNAVVLGKGDRYFILLRFHPNIHIAHLEAGLKQVLQPDQYTKAWDEIYASRSRNLLLASGQLPHEREKIGPGPQVIETEEGWLLIYHAVGEISQDVCGIYGLNRAIERGYSVCAALLDLEDPSRVICRTRHPIYIPSHIYELEGNEHYPVDVPNVVFPVGAVVCGQKLVVYAGAGDKYIVLLSCNLQMLVEFLKKHCVTSQD